MDPPRTSRLLDPALAAITKHKAEAIRLAKEQGATVKEMCRRAKSETPPYEFEELIGKGAYGRVYKGYQVPSGKVVAIKVMDIDSVDYNTIRDRQDESIKDFIHETKVMKQVKDAGAKNINELIEAVSIHSQLWLVCEYCPGGSVRTLMRGTGDRLHEKFIIPIARELAEGLRAIHAAGIIHRDVKAANILIHEEGRLQICDFGVAGIVQSNMDKRSTWVGTPHWMPPEMFSHGDDYQYGSEIDVWAYGCTLIECATGRPPNAGLQERLQIGRQLNRKTPKLEGDKYSEGLRDLVGFSLDSDPATRPTMKDILSHSYIADSADEYPTSCLSELVRIYYQWAQRGGQRMSLFHHGGAAAAEFPGENDSEGEDWNFSTTDGFERRFSVIDLDQLAASLAELEQEMSPQPNQPDHDSFESASDSEMTPNERANFNERVRRGAEALEGLFDEEKPSYKYETKTDFVPVEQKQAHSDLPLRTETDRSSVTSTFIDIDIGSFDSSHYAAGTTSTQPFQLADADTIRATRTSGRFHQSSSEERLSQTADSDTSTKDLQEVQFEEAKGPRPLTQDWKFPAFMQPAAPAMEVGSIASQPLEDKRATMNWTFPQMIAPADSMATSAAGEDANAGIGLGVIEETNRYDTLRAPIVQMEETPSTVRLERESRLFSIGEPGDATFSEPDESRPSTATSVVSESATSDADYDPFKFDHPHTPTAGASSAHSQYFGHQFNDMMDSSGYPDFESSSVLDGPGPDEEEGHPVWSDSSLAAETSQIEPFPTAIPLRMLDTGAANSGDALQHHGSYIPEPLATARRGPAAPVIQAAATAPIYFPELTPPSLESLMEGADENVVTAELDRLIGDFITALGANAEALSRVSFDSSTSGI